MMQVRLHCLRLKRNPLFCSQSLLLNQPGSRSLLSHSIRFQNQPLARRNARGSIGVDTAYLDRQIEEKRLRDAQISHQEKQEAEYMREFSKRLDEYEAAANVKMSQKLQDLRRTLEEQVKHPKNNALANGVVDFDKCGPSSIQIFQGEDDAHTERKKTQQQQLKVWASELMAEKERARLEEQKQEQEYARRVLQTDGILGNMEEQVLHRKEERAKLQQLENMKMAQEAELRRKMEAQADKAADAKQTLYLQTCQLLTEDTKGAANQIRPDHFKGFDKDQIHNFYRENDVVLVEKRKKAAQEADLEKDWAMHEAEMIRRMDEAEQLRQQRIAEDNRNYGNTLHKQREEFRLRNTKTEVPGIGTHFFERFGSCR